MHSVKHKNMLSTPSHFGTAISKGLNFRRVDLISNCSRSLFCRSLFWSLWHLACSVRSLQFSIVTAKRIPTYVRSLPSSRLIPETSSSELWAQKSCPFFSWNSLISIPPRVHKTVCRARYRRFRRVQSWTDVPLGPRFSGWVISDQGSATGLTRVTVYHESKKRGNQWFVAVCKDICVYVCVVVYVWLLV